MPWKPTGLWEVEAPRFLDNWLTNGGAVISVTHRPAFTPQEDSWYSFLLEVESNSVGGRIKNSVTSGIEPISEYCPKLWREQTEANQGQYI
jgi:hypothetical protein